MTSYEKTLTNRSMETAPALPSAKPQEDLQDGELDGFSFRILSRILRQGKRRLMQGTLLSIALATLIAFLLPVQYTSTASMIPPSSTTSSSAALMGQLSALGGGGMLGAIKSPGDLYVGLLKSRSIAAELVKRFELKKVYGVKKESEAEKILAAKTDVAVGTKDAILTISVTDHDPSRARDLATGYLDALRSMSTGLALTESSQRRLFYEQRLAQEKDDLANAEVALKQSQETTGLIAPAGQTASEIQAIAEIRAQIAGREVRLSSLRHDETDENPDILRIRSEIANLQGQVAQMESGTGKGISAARVPALELEYIRKSREVKYHEALFEIIAKQYEAARLDEAHDPPLQVLDRANLPDVKSGPPRMLIILAGALAGFCSGSLWVIVIEARRRTLSAFPEGMPNQHNVPLR